MAPTPDGGDKRQIGAELVIPVMALVFTLYYFSTIIDSPWTAQVNAFLVGSILITVVLLFFIVAARELWAGRATLSVASLLTPFEILGKRAAFFGLTLAYLVTMRWLGFTLGTFLLLLASMLVLNGGRRVGLAVALSAIMAGVAYLFFIYLFQTRFPEGPFEHLIKALA